MPISFTKHQNTVRIRTTLGNDVGSVEVLEPPLAGRLFAESHMPKVGDIIIFDAPPTPDLYVDSIRAQGRDMPKTTTIPGNSPDPVTYVFAVANGPSEWTVTAVGQDDSVTIMRGET